MDVGTLYGLGIAIILTGILIILASILLLVISNIRSGGGKGKAGGAIVIGPIPIIFGTDKKSVKTILILSILLTTLLIIVTIILYLMSK